MTIIPRWEWRTFGEDLGPAAERLGSLTPERVEESEDAYLLSSSADASVKVRAERVDVKNLVRVRADGLEQWRPVLKAPFPLGTDDVMAVFAALEVDGHARVRRPVASFDALLDELRTGTTQVTACRLHKRRTHYAIGGCRAEVTELRTGSRATRTLAVESEDRDRVVATLGELGLAGRTNVCMARGLKALVGVDPERRAVIDVGTNSVKFHVAERSDDGSWIVVRDRADVTRLGEGLEKTGAIAAEAASRTAEAIRRMVDEATADGALAIAAVGTAGLRIASNADEVLDAIQDRAHVRVEVIPGDEESRLAFLAVKQGIGLGEGRLAVFDTGGGSTQLTFGSGDRVDERWSVDVGAVRYTERFGLDGAVSREVLEEALAAISADLSRLDGHEPVDALVGMGGAITNITAVKHQMATYDPDVVQGTVLDRAELDRQIERYRARDAAGRREIVGLQPKRADVILAGACIVRTVMDKLGRDSLTVSDRGLRHGVLAERFGG
jgi:exopolyphosphatase/guanosine-5'-triphosphate,3'-diphosphate pyrophosphatase